MSGTCILNKSRCRIRPENVLGFGWFFVMLYDDMFEKPIERRVDSVLSPGEPIGHAIRTQALYLASRGRGNTQQGCSISTHEDHR